MICVYSRNWLWGFPSQHISVSQYWLTLVFGPAPKTTHVLQGGYRHQTAHFEPLTSGAMFELVTERLSFLSLLPQISHVIIEDLKVKCSGTLCCKRLFVQQEYLPCFQIGVSIKTGCGLNWKMWMLVCCWLMWWVIFAYYVSGRQRFNEILPGSRELFMPTIHQVKYPFSWQASWLLL